MIHMKKILLILFLQTPVIAFSQLEITEEATPIEEDFQWFLGSGFTPGQSIEGSIDSDIVATRSNPTTLLDFGDYSTSGEFARGISTGGASIDGGIYAFETGDGNIGFGIKPSYGYYSPGRVFLKIQNKISFSPSEQEIVITSLQVSFDIWYNNTTDKITTVDFLYSTGHENYKYVNGKTFSTPGSAAPGWTKKTLQYVLTNELNELNISENEAYYLKLSFDSNDRTTYSDEVAIDNIKIIANPSVIFSEVLQKPTSIDANDDGVAEEWQDEFIEMIAYDKTEVTDIAGWKIYIDGMLRHIFPVGSGLIPDQAAVVFGGGTPMGDFGGVLLQTALTGYLDIPDNGEITITLTDASDIEKASAYIDTGTGLVNDSWHLDGYYIAHSTYDEDDPKSHSPGKKINDKDIYLDDAIVWNNKTLSWVEYSDALSGTSSVNVIINGNNLVMTKDIITDNITVNGTLTVPSGRFVTIANYLINPGIFTIQSGGILHSSNNILGEVVIKRNSPWGDSEGRYSFIGSPVENYIIGDLGASFHNRFIEATNSYEPVSPGEVMAPGIGYTSANKQELIFTGRPNAGNVAVQISKNTGGQDFNLLANPYSAPVTYTSFMTENGPGGAEAVTGTIYIWDDGGSNSGIGSSSDFRTITAAGDAGGTTNTGSSWNGSIGSVQAFFVVGDIANGNMGVEFKENMRQTSGNEDSYFFRKAESEISRFKLGIGNGDTYYETLVAFIDDATNGYDKLYDGPMHSVSEKAKIYSYIEGKKYSIQAFSPVLEKQIIGLGIDIPSDGKYQIDLHSLENVDHLELYLNDLKTGRMIDLRENNFVYEFIANKGLNQNRFILIASTSRIMALDESLESQFKINYSKGSLNVFLNNYDGGADVTIYDISGRIVNHFYGTFSQGNMTRKLNYSLNNLYIINLELTGKQYTTKFITQ